MSDVVGAVGMVALLTAFLANIAGRLQSDSLTYNAANAIGAGILAWYSMQVGVWIFAVLESVWAIAAVWRLARAVAARPMS